jgi:hypothetical protein
MFYASASREDLWHIDEGRPSLLESRSDRGSLREISAGRFQGGTDIAAASQLEPERAEEIIRQLGLEMGSAPPWLELELPSVERIRHQIKTTFVSRNGTEELRSEEVFELTVPTPESPRSLVIARRDLGALKSTILRLRASASATEAADWQALPLLWRNGSGGALLHEAIGHRASSGRPLLQWPRWLDALDDPSGLMRIDDDGLPAWPTNLASGNRIELRRRESFRDAAIPRMTHLRISGTWAIDNLPFPRIEIFETAHGNYDPLTDTVEVAVAAAEQVGDDDRTSLRPFLFRCPAESAARNLLGTVIPIETASSPNIGMFGQQGVTCTMACLDEGQRILVASTCPDLLLARMQP